MAPSAERFLGFFLLVGHSPWAARIELRIGARFIFLNSIISHNILHVKLESLRPELAASRVGPPGAMVNACIDQLI